MVPVAAMPSISTSPAVGSSGPAMILKIVLLPQPEGPIRLTKRPCGIDSVTGASAWKTPAGVLKVMLTLSTRSFGAGDMNPPLSTTLRRHCHSKSLASDAPAQTRRTRFDLFRSLVRLRLEVEVDEL